MSLTSSLSKPTAVEHVVTLRHRLRGFAVLMIVLSFFWQIWFDIGGITIRLEDLLVLALLAESALPTLFTLRWEYIETKLNWPVLVAGTTVLISIVVTLLLEYSFTVKKDALINGIRLVFALLLYFLVVHHQSEPDRKAATFLRVVIGFSFITTTVCLLQALSWEYLLPFKLPAALTTFAPGASRGFGKEIFGLYLGNTGAHLWSALLSMQLLTVWFVGSQQKQKRMRLLSYAYVILLLAILVRISVRNSILGIIVALMFAVVFLSANQKNAQHVIRQAVTIRRALVAVIGLVFVSFVVLYLFSDLPAVERILDTIPKFENGRWVISRRSNIFGRLEANYMALRIFARYPLFGSGFWSFSPMMLKLSLVTDLVHAHNTFLQILAELGLVGAIAWGWLLTRITVSLYQGRPADSAPEENEDATHFIIWQLASASFVFCLFTGLFAIPLFQPAQLGWLMVLLGLLLSFPSTVDADPSLIA